MCLPFVYKTDGTVSSNNNLNALRIPFQFRKRDQTLYFPASSWDYLSPLHRIGHKTFVLLCTLLLDPLLLKPVHCVWPCLGKSEYQYLLFSRFVLVFDCFTRVYACASFFSF